MEQKSKFSGIKNMLSRDEMKQIKGGSGSDLCYSGSPCHGTGTCFSYYTGNTEHCCCSVDIGSDGGSYICSV